MARILVTLVYIVFCIGCGGKINVNEDNVYSRHLQKQVNLVILSTPVPSEKSDFNLLILNDGQDLEKLELQSILDSLWKKKAIKPLLVVGIEITDRKDLYGVAGMPDYEKNGQAAEKYSKFINNELFAHIKKMSGVKKFNSVIYAGFGLGGLSAFDISWDNWQKIDKVGVFSGSFGVSNLKQVDLNETTDESNIVLSKISSSRKRPKLKYWFYAGGIKSSDKKTNQSDNSIYTQKLIELLVTKKTFLHNF